MYSTIGQVREEQPQSFARCAMDAVMRRVQRVKSGAMVAATGAIAFVYGGTASAQVVLPDVGVDPSEYVTAAATFLGGAIATVLGVFFVYKSIKVVLKWTGKIGG